jgi:RNA polymerase sigma-70 factor (ECF subfamily)
VTDHRDDVERVRRMLAGDGEAFEDFARRTSKALYRFAFARLDGDRELTREIAQTALCKVLANLHTYRGDSALLTWACACCRNEILMHFRRNRTHPDEVGLEDDVEPAVGFRPAGGDPEAAGNPEAAALRREAAARVHMALDVLPEHYARALEWKYLERVPVKEIAARMEMRPKAAESLLTRARQAFRDGYEGLRSERDSFVAGR